MSQPHESADDLTMLLRSWANGDPDALDRLMPLAYSACGRNHEPALDEV